jgi:hypothetical protein
MLYKIGMNKQTFEYKPCIVLQGDVDDECWVIGVLLKRTAKRFYVYNAVREKAEYYKHVKFEKTDNYPYWEEVIKEAKKWA